MLWRAPNFVLSPLRLSGVKKGTFSTPESTPEYISIVDKICTYLYVFQSKLSHLFKTNFVVYFLKYIDYPLTYRFEPLLEDKYIKLSYLLSTYRKVSSSKKNVYLGINRQSYKSMFNFIKSSFLLVISLERMFQAYFVTPMEDN